MFPLRSRLVADSLVLAALLVLVPVGRSQDAAPKEPAPKAKDGAKQPDPLQALKDAFAKGVTQTPIEMKDLPKEIADAAARKVPGASIKKAEKQEIRHTLKYVPFAQPRIESYQIIVAGKDGKRFRVQLSADGAKSKTQPLDEPKATKEVKAGKEIEIPEAARKSVKAIKDLYPDAVVEEITTEVYQDPSGIVDVLTYEIEFISKGAKHEMVASPDGVIPHLWNPHAEKDLPKAIVDAIGKEVPGGTVKSAKRYEVRAGLEFGPLEKARVIYRLELDKDGAASKLVVRADGTIAPASVRPGGNRAFLGLAFEKNSMAVAQVTKGGPADKGGVQVGDRIAALGETKVASTADVLRILQSLRPGAEVTVHFQRGDRNLTAAVKLGAPPE